MKILFCTSEVQPFSKEGGLADFSASLPKALINLGNEVNIVSPYYKEVLEQYGSDAIHLGSKNVTYGDYSEVANYYLIKRNNINYYFVAHSFFNRDKYYDYRDDAKRFVFFNAAILEMLSLINFYPDIIHVNNWHTALIPYFLDSIYINNPNYNNIKTLLSIHTLEKQGSFPMGVEVFFTKKNYTYQHLDQINFLKAGIMRSTKINTVSQSYREEILTKFFGFSLNGPLKSRHQELYGIQNGIDFSLFNPLTDQNIKANYDINNYTKGKLVNKQALLDSLKFSDYNKPVISMVGRLAREKGIDLVMDFIDELLSNDLIYFIVAGQGDFEYEDFFETLNNKYPNNFHFYPGHHDEINQLIFAASDIFLMPSLYEASGLNQMIAMRYGSVPIVRKTGGLKDTVSQFSENNNAGNGFLFENYDSDELKDTIINVLSIYNDSKDTWNKIIENGMNTDNSIKRMAESYNELYKKIYENE